MRYVSLGIAFALALVSCGGELVPTAPVADTSVAPAGALNGDGQAGVNAAGRPAEWTWVEGPFSDVDPCHTEIQTAVTITWVCRVSGHDDVQVATCKRATTISPSGYVGRSTASWVSNGHIYNFRFTDILENAAGDRARVDEHDVFDLAKGVVRVGWFRMTCLGK